jgi:hypothetical protein
MKKVGTAGMDVGNLLAIDRCNGHDMPQDAVHAPLVVCLHDTHVAHTGGQSTVATTCSHHRLQHL